MKLEQILAEANTLQQINPVNQFYGTTDGLRVNLFGKFQGKTYEKGLFQWVEVQKEITPCEKGDYPFDPSWEQKETFYGLLTPKGVKIVEAWLVAENQGLLKKAYSSPCRLINSPRIEDMDLTNPKYLK